MNALPVPATWSPDELHRRYTTAPTVAIGRRYHALYLRRLGHGPGAVATLLGVSTQAIREWVTLATTAGLDRLARPAGSVGQPAKLTAVQQETVMGWLDVAPRLRLRDLRARIAETWTVSLSTTQVWALVKRHGGRQIVPRTRHYQADVGAQAAFKIKCASGCGRRARGGIACSFSMRHGGG